jgi:precorrin-2 dehydrogenase/sirohydrochlorin ferrochelatase
VELAREKRVFASEDIEGCTLVFAATGDEETNQRIALLCRERNILCNVADDPDLSDFLVPAVWQQANIQVAVSTSGASPALAAHIRDELAIFLNGRYTVLVQLLEYLRPLLLRLDLGAKQNKILFRQLMDAGLPTALQVRDHHRTATILYTLLPKEIHADIEPFLSTLAARPERTIQ